MNSDVAADRDASYRDIQLFVAFSGGVARVRTVHIQRFDEGDPERFQQFIAGTFLAIHPGNLFDPANPLIWRTRCNTC